MVPRKKVPGMIPPHAPNAAPVAPMTPPHLAPVTPHLMPVPGQKHAGPNPGRWDRLQQYLQRPASPLAPVKPDEKEVP